MKNEKKTREEGRRDLKGCVYFLMNLAFPIHYNNTSIFKVMLGRWIGSA